MVMVRLPPTGFLAIATVKPIAFVDPMYTWDLHPETAISLSGLTCKVVERPTLSNSEEPDVSTRKEVWDRVSVVAEMDMVWERLEVELKYKTAGLTPRG